MGKKKEEEKQSPPLIFYGIILAFVVLTGINFAGDYTRSTDAKFIVETVTNNQGVIGYLDKDTVKEAHDNIKAGIEKQAANLVKINTTVTENKATGKANKDEITTTKLDIKNKFPQAADVDITSSSVGANTPFLTLTIDKTSYLPGETIIFTGTANPDATVIINLQKYGGCGRDDVCAAWTTVDKNGNFYLEFETEFDDPEGAWKAYVKEGQNRSQTIVFEVAK